MSMSRLRAGQAGRDAARDERAMARDMMEFFFRQGQLAINDERAALYLPEPWGAGMGTPIVEVKRAAGQTNITLLRELAAAVADAIVKM